VTDMSEMFEGATAFNQDLSSWDVSQVTDMSGMFAHATALNQNLCSWGEKVSASVVVTNEFDGTTMFEGSGCPVQLSPNTSVALRGPWCHACLS
jgi:surface protein